ncbi:MAG TPA: hypothetical protein DCE41_35880 [Cytophagales bacterium]|nr:hypothetical protein [Cytophagales bacterium]
MQNVTQWGQHLKSQDLMGEQLEASPIALRWNALDPAGTQGYVVERSRDGRYFEIIARLMHADGYLEAVQFAKAFYYRLHLLRTDEGLLTGSHDSGQRSGHAALGGGIPQPN